MKNKIIILFCFAFVFGCKKNTDSTAGDIEETAQQIGDVMASIDESGGSSGSIALQEKFYQNTFERFSPGEKINENAVASLFLPKAEAASCFGSGFGACTARAITRNFAGCTLLNGAATLSGTVTVTWTGPGSACSVGVAPTSDSKITRVPNFTLTGRRASTLTVTKTSTTGQSLTFVSGTSPNFVFDFRNDGINRQFKDSNNNVVFDQTTYTTSAIRVTGSARTNRVMNGGSLTVANNLTGVNCSYAPTNVTWDSAICNCPTQGSWAGTCTDGKSATLTINSCGNATYTEGNDSTTIAFDRCGN